MATNIVDDYGWTDPTATLAAGYITPAVLEILNKLGARRVVDIGSGNGSLCGALAGAGLNPYGIEYDAAGVQIARRAHPALRFYERGIQDDSSDIVAAEGMVDAAVSTEVVEHLFSPHLLPLFVRKLVRPGGHLVITTPYHGYVKNLALSLANKWDHHHTPLWHGGHIKFWSRDTLTKLLTDGGLTVTGFQGVGRLPWLWKSMVLIARVD